MKNEHLFLKFESFLKVKIQFLKNKYCFYYFYYKYIKFKHKGQKYDPTSRSFVCLKEEKQESRCLMHFV